MPERCLPSGTVGVTINQQQTHRTYMQDITAAAVLLVTAAVFHAAATGTWPTGGPALDHTGLLRRAAVLLAIAVLGPRMLLYMRDLAQRIAIAARRR